MNYVRLDAGQLRRALEISNEAFALRDNLSPAGRERAEASRPPVKRASRQDKPFREQFKWPLLLGLLSVAYLQYFYAGVMMTIASLPALIVFIALP